MAPESTTLFPRFGGSPPRLSGLWSAFSKRLFSSPPTTGGEGVDAAAAPNQGPDEEPKAQETRPSFEEVYESYFGFVWRNVANRGVPPSLMDDVVQEVFMVVHRKLPEFEGRSSLRTWLSAIVRGVVRDQLRKRGHRPAGEPMDDMDLAGGVGPAEALEQKAAAELFDELVAGMSEAQREVFLLVEVEQMTGAEVAEALELNENTVRTRLRAARRLFAAGVARKRASERWGSPRGGEGHGG